MGYRLREVMKVDDRARVTPSREAKLCATPTSLSSGELLNYTNHSREVGVSAKVISSYFQILEDTLLGFRIPPWRKSKNRKLVETEKFYLFDVGVSNYLAKRTPQPKTPEFGKSFEHLVLMELLAYRAYRAPELEISFWRTSDKLYLK